jgi:Flp pilus assembly protein TadG
VLAAAAMVMVFAFAAFAIDVGYMTMTRSQLQNASDAAALAGGMKLLDGLGPKPLGASTVSTSARQAAVELAAQNGAGDVASVYVDGTADVELGRRVWNTASQTWTETWGTAPYDLIRVTARRDQPNGSNGDRTLPLFFAPVIGNNTATLSVTATATISPGGGFRIPTGSGLTAPILPIALDEPTWNALIAGSGTDGYSYNSSGTVTSGSDGILEVNIYPNGSTDLPPGNRGTVDFGSPNNSTADLSRQIRYGLNETDLSFFPNGTVTTDDGPLQLNGDTGLSAGIKDDLASIIGQPRAIPLFTQVAGPGNNAMYTIVRFVGIRLLHVQLTGSPSNKKVIVQPATVTSDTVLAGNGSSTTTYIYSRIRLIH